MSILSTEICQTCQPVTTQLKIQVKPWIQVDAECHNHSMQKDSGKPVLSIKTLQDNKQSYHLAVMLHHFIYHPMLL